MNAETFAKAVETLALEELERQEELRECIDWLQWLHRRYGEQITHLLFDRESRFYQELVRLQREHRP